MIADSSKSVYKFYHFSSLVLVGLTPLALINPYESNYISLPFDMLLGTNLIKSSLCTDHFWFLIVPFLLLGILFPIHSHIALNYVISDYVPKASRSLVRAGLLGATIVAAAGILKLNLAGPGLTDVIKSLWRSPKVIEEKK